MLNLARHFKNAVTPLVRCALDLDPTARGAWLNELRCDCPSVIRELERQLPPALDSSLAIQSDIRPRDIIPGSLEHLGLRC